MCNGSTADSDSVCWGSNPYSAAKKSDHHPMVVFSFFLAAVEDSHHSAEPCSDFIVQSTISLIYKAYALIYLRKCDIIDSPINKNLTKEMCNEQQRHYKIFLRSGCLRKPA